MKKNTTPAADLREPMRNETPVQYDAGTITDTKTDAAPATMLADAKIRLTGYTVPAVQIRNASELSAFCADLISGSAVEEFRVICANAQMQVISEAMISRGTIDSVDAYPRSIAQIALLSNAFGIFLTHNHPGGTCYPSSADITSTLQIKKALALFNIQVIDHVIVTPDGRSYSMRQHGDIC